ncbi:MAG: pseudouridine synthase, partial [Proteobacteria bacterium]|nr:pseudouridine synthase [Pseudomonadota bacterium]
MRENLILLNKPWGVLCQFTGESPNLSDLVNHKGYYPAGRLDKDSEGLLLLTRDGSLQARIADPKFKMEKTYWVQVEGELTDTALEHLRRGVELKDGRTRPARARRIDCP